MASWCSREFTYDDKLVMTLGEALGRGEDERHFGRPTDIDWLPDGTFFVSDGYINTRVVKFDPNGKYLLSWTDRGSSAHRPLYVAEVFNGRAQKFRPRNGADPVKLTGQELRLGALWTK